MSFAFWNFSVFSVLIYIGCGLTSCLPTDHWTKKNHLTRFAHWRNIELGSSFSHEISHDVPLEKQCALCVWKPWVAVRQPKAGPGNLAESFCLVVHISSESHFPISSAVELGWDWCPPSHSISATVIGSGMGMEIHTRMSLQFLLGLLELHLSSSLA